VSEIRRNRVERVQRVKLKDKQSRRKETVRTGIRPYTGMKRRRDWSSDAGCGPRRRGGRWRSGGIWGFLINHELHSEGSIYAINNRSLVIDHYGGIRNSGDRIRETRAYEEVIRYAS
jgi:hypothetical protein